LRLLARRQARSLPEPWASAMRSEDGTLAAARTQRAELEVYGAGLRRLRAEPLPTVPGTVISGGEGGWTERRRRPALVAAHRARAEAAPRGRHVVAGASGHLVPFAEPELVAAEIARVVDAVRA
jgi:pimeloyl-ACP methyl ester carboxylesterase